jgi:hypothetical protein
MLPRIQQKHSVAIPKIVGGRIAPTSRFAQNSVRTQVLVTTFSPEVDCFGDLANLVRFNPPLISLICGNVQSQQGRLAIPSGVRLSARPIILSQLRGRSPLCNLYMWKFH